MMSDFIVFYSWQSDLPNATNRSFIGDALEKGCKQIAINPLVQVSPRLDQDTKGLPGAPLIPQAIMEKIDACQAFVADVSFCYKADDGTLSPNPNVVYELGYAVARLGWDRIILVINTDFGPLESLPFDLEKRRAIAYIALEREKDRSEVKKNLATRLAHGIEALAQLPPPVPTRSPFDNASAAIEKQFPSRPTQILEFWKWAMEELQRIESDRRSSLSDGENVSIQLQTLKVGIEDAGEVSRLWSLLCKAVAEANDAESAEALTEGFTRLLEEYDFKPNWTCGSFSREWFDFWRFIGHELWTVWIGCLLTAKRWELIQTTLNTQFYWKQHYDKINVGFVTFEKLSKVVNLLESEGRLNGRSSTHADVLQKRYGAQGISSALTFEEFIEADLLLYIYVELNVEPGHPRKRRWVPVSVSLMAHQPQFLIWAVQKKYATGLKLAWGEGNSDKIKKLIREQVPGLIRGFRCGVDCPVTNEVIDAFDTKG